MEAFENLCELFRKRGDAEAEKALKDVSEEWRSMQRLLKKEEPSIKGIKKKWKKLQDAASRSFQQIASSLQSEEDSSSSSEGSTTNPSESESSSSSDSSDEESGSDEESNSESESSSSSEESNSISESEPVQTKQRTSTKAKTQNENKSRLPDKSKGSNSEKGAGQNDSVKNKSLALPSAEESSSSSSSSDDDTSSSSSSSDDDSDSDSDGSDDSDSDSDESSIDSNSESEEDRPPKKKRKTENGGNFTKRDGIEQRQPQNAAEETDEAPTQNGSLRPNGIHDSTNSSTPGSSTPNSVKNGKNDKQHRKSNAPFQRIKVDAVKFADERLKDNSFHSRGAKAGDYGAKAHADLIVTRGDSFRKEKNKKKRGSYRGGEITLESHSIKFS